MNAQDAGSPTQDATPTKLQQPDPQAPQADLDALYAPPSERIQRAVLDHLLDFHKAYLRKATFFCLATGSEHGLDASPRGGPPGFVHVLDENTVAFADWPGNNRIESLRNLQRDQRLAMVFLFPGLEIFLRINGRGRISTDKDLLSELREGVRMPKTATVVQIDEVLFHCGKAINRAQLWKDSARLDRDTLPTVGDVLAAIGQLHDASSKLDDAQVQQINEHYDQSVRNDLY